MPPEAWALLESTTIADIFVIFVTVGGVVVSFKWLAPMARWARDFSDAWNGRPARPGMAAEPGVPERLQTMEHDLAIAKATADETLKLVRDLHGQMTDQTQAIVELYGVAGRHHPGTLTAPTIPPTLD